MTTIINIRDHNRDRPDDEYVFIGRPTKWGNPFKIGVDGTREQVVEKYREWIKTQPQLLEALHELKGKELVCFCKPHPCHGDVLVDLCYLF